jgi:peptidyl-prolyl cis-trans isomerase C
MAFGSRTALIAALAACLPLAGCGENELPAEEFASGDLSAEAAIVNGQIIYVSDVELEARMKGVIKPGESLEPGSAEFDEILDELIEVKLLAMEALGRGLDEEPESRHRLNTARDNILGNILLERIAAEEIDEAAIRKMYEAQVQLLEPQMENEARVRHILAPNKETIDKIAAELKTGVDFAVLAARRSSDEATRLDGGDLGFITADETSPELARVIREVPEGGVSRPFEDTAGWHIVKIEQVRKRRPPSIDVLRETIERYLKSQQLEKIMKELRGEAEIVKRNAPRSSGMDTPAATAPAKVEPAAPPATQPTTSAATPTTPPPAAAPVTTTPAEPATTPAQPPVTPAPAPGAPQ